MTFQPAPEWQTAEWFNSKSSLSLAQLRGKVILLHAFQMLCPGCVANALPQAKRAAQLFAGAPLVVVGLHSVFEHHAVMGADALRAFLYEYRIEYPVAIDQPGSDGDPRPLTMRAYAMQGTPTTILIDAAGRLRQHVFGPCDDLWLGSEIGRLLAEAARPAQFVPVALGGAAVGTTCSIDGTCG